MHLRHKLRIYPPRIQMTVRLKTVDDIRLPITFEGCSNDSQLNVELTFPIGNLVLKLLPVNDFLTLLVTRDSLPSSPTSSSSSNRVLPQSHKILCEFHQE